MGKDFNFTALGGVNGEMNWSLENEEKFYKLQLLPDSWSLQVVH